MLFSELVHKAIKDIGGYVTTEFGDDVPVFKISKIIFEDDTSIWVEGEHDIPYIPSSDKIAGLDIDTLLSFEETE